MSTANVLMSKISQLEELPNELFFFIFSYLKSDIIIETFFNLNQRFQLLILQSIRYLILPIDTKISWINKHMLSIQNDIETIILSLHHIHSVFFNQYSYPNLRKITLYSDIDWQVEIHIKNESPISAIISTLNLLEKCSFKQLDQNFLKIFQSNKSFSYESCSAIRHVSVFKCHQNNLWKLCEMTPELIYLKVWLRPSRTYNHNRIISPLKTSFPTCLNELYIKILHRQCFDYIRILVDYYQTSLKRITLDLGEDLLIDGRKLEALLSPYASLENISFITQISKEKKNISNLLYSFQTEWWLDIRRPSVLILETNFGNVLIASMPCSFSNILKQFHFPTDLKLWHLNKENLDSLSKNCMKTNKIFFSSKQPISLDFLTFASRIFCSKKQVLSCNYWGLMFEEKFFQEHIYSTITLLNVTRLKINHINSLSPLTLTVWLLLAPNVHILEIEYLTFSEILEWITEFNDAFVKSNNQHMKIIFQRIQKITISCLCYNCHEKSRQEICTILMKIFPNSCII